MPVQTGGGTYVFLRKHCSSISIKFDLVSVRNYNIVNAGYCNIVMFIYSHILHVKQYRRYPRRATSNDTKRKEKQTKTDSRRAAK